MPSNSSTARPSSVGSTSPARPASTSSTTFPTATTRASPTLAAAKNRASALLARKVLIFGAVTLYSFVRVSHQSDLMPPDLVRRLTLTQHRTLLPLPDPERKEELARRVLSEGWPSQILAQEVSELLPKSRRGRKPSPDFVKAIRRVGKALERPFIGDLTDEIFRLGPEQTAVLIAKIEENLNRLETLRRTLDETRNRLWPDAVNGLA